jgi:hypothetical protein
MSNVKEVVDILFEDCNRIANKYETNLLTVLECYTDFEMRLKNNLDYKTIIGRTEQSIKDKFYSRLRSERNG